MPKGALEVIEYVPRPAAMDVVPINRFHESEDLWSRLRLQHRTLKSCVAALAALALHTAFLAPVLWGGGGLSHRQALSYRGNAAMQWVILAESSSKSESTRPSLSPPTLTAIAVTDAATKLPSSILPPQAGSGSNEADSAASLGTMYGRYLGQIHARVDRAWRRPRTAIGTPIFQCQVQVDQDSLGRVEQVTLLDCNGDTSWQLSLVHAIEAASPLPAPPTPAVFAHHVLIAFRAAAYRSGAAAELYEPPAVVTASAEAGEGGTVSQQAFQALREAVQARKPRVLELQIEGSKVDVEPDRQ